MRTLNPAYAVLRSKLGLSIAIGALAVAGVQAADLEDVTVTAPTVKTMGRDATGTPIRQLSGTVRVQFNPIMLTTNSGRALLDDKVADAARRLCSADGTIPNTDDDGSCVQQAIKATKVQIAAVAAQQKAG